MATPTMTTVYVRLEIEGKPADASHVVDSLVDAGFLQDAINEHDVEDSGPLRVKVAVVRTAAQVEHAMAYRAFVRARIEEDGLSFHPDDPMASYIDRQGNDVYTKAEARELQAEHDRLFDAVRDEDPYEIALGVLQEAMRGEPPPDPSGRETVRPTT